MSDDDLIRRGDVRKAIGEAVRARAKDQGGTLMQTQLAVRAYENALYAIPALEPAPMTLAAALALPEIKALVEAVNGEHGYCNDDHTCPICAAIDALLPALRRIAEGQA